MARICLVSCAGKKRTEKAPASALYTSSLFRKASALAAKQYDRWYILSAKHGLLHPDTVIESYDQTLNGMSIHQREKWAKEVFHKLRDEISRGDTITILAGSRYREKLVPFLEEAGFEVEVPMAGMSIGKQLQWLGAQVAG